MARKQYKFRCYDRTCYGHKDPYNLPRDLEGAEGSVVVQCPYCGKEAIVNLAPWQTPKEAVFRGIDTAETEKISLILPDIIPTEPMPKDGEDESDA